MTYYKLAMTTGMYYEQAVTIKLLKSYLVHITESPTKHFCARIDRIVCKNDT